MITYTNTNESRLKFETAALVIYNSEPTERFRERERDLAITRMLDPLLYCTETARKKDRRKTEERQKPESDA